MKCYVIMDMQENYVLAYSTTYFENMIEVVMDNPVMDMSKLVGYKLIYKEDSLGHLVFDEEQYNRITNAINKQVSTIKANEKLNELIKVNVLDSASDEDAFEMRYIYPTWLVDNDYKLGERFMYEDKFYKVLQDHKSQADWTPNTAVSLYVEISDPSVEYPEFRQPTGSQDAYMKDDKVTYNGIKYISLIDNNVWSPTDYPQGWQVVE